jgi:methanogenic corrinoid protein MtbC1
VVIGSVEGNIHDIGKNIVKLMLEVGGFEVHDLGNDVPADKFVEEQIKTSSEIVAMSAMMTTTMMGMKKAIKIKKEKNPDVDIMIGDATVNKEVASLFGADGYAKSAANVAEEADKIISQLRKL